MDHIKEIMLEKIQDAELILVGIGEDFGDSLEKMKDIPEMAAYMEKIAEREDLQWLLPHVEAVYVKKYRDKRKTAAYKVLGQLLENKNYFILSTEMDDYIYDSGLKKEKIVTPCGGYQLLQCEDACDNTVHEVQENFIDQLYEKIKNGDMSGLMKPPVCPVCGKRMVYNNKKAEKYVEAGYLEDWQNYTRWLQGTVNKKLCVLEMGVGMKYPNVIRWPFEKVVYFNQKASMFRIHSKLYQLTEEIKDKGYKIKEKPIDFLINRFV